MKRPNDMIPEDELSGSQGVQYATREEWRRITNSPRMNEAAGQKQLWYSVVDESGNESKTDATKNSIV